MPNLFPLNGAQLNGSGAPPPAVNYTRLYTRVQVLSQEGVSSLSTKLSVVVAQPGKVRLYTAVRVTAEGASRLRTNVQVFSQFLTDRWSARVIINNVDWSWALTGSVEVDAEEGSARVASFTLRPPNGVIDPVQWTAKAVTIDLARIVNGVSYYSRAFTGIVEVGSYDPNTRLFALDCTDDLQLSVAKMTRTSIDKLTGAVYSEAVMGEIEDNWDYAQALMETREASLDKSRYGVTRVTPWQGLPLWTTFGMGDLLDLSLDVAMLRRSELVNEVHIDSQYRYFLCRERGDGLGWSQLNAYSMGFRKTGMVRPTISEVISAIEGASGWKYLWGSFSGANYDITKYASCGMKMEGIDFGGELGTWWHVIENDAVSTFIARIGMRYAQTITEYADIVVRAPQSIAANGALPKSFTVSAESQWDSSKWESWEEDGLYPEYDPETQTASGDLIPTEPEGGYGVFEIVHAPDMTRADMQEAQEVAIAKAKVMIIASHRKAMAKASIDCRPEIDLDLRIAIDTDTLDATGKVSRVVHTLDIEAGTAITDFTLALSGIGAVGIADPDALVAPEEVDPGIEPDVWVTPDLTTCIPGTCAYNDNKSGLIINPPTTIPFIKIDDPCTQVGSMSATVDPPNGAAFPFSGFRVVLDGVDDEHRDAKIAQGGKTYDIAIPIDPLTQIV